MVSHPHVWHLTESQLSDGTDRPGGGVMDTCAKQLFVEFCKDRKTEGWCSVQKQQNIYHNLKENLTALITSLITSLHLLLHLIHTENDKPKIPVLGLFVLVSNK